MVNLVTEISFVENNDLHAASAKRHLVEQITKTVEAPTLRTVTGVRLVDIKAAEIRD